MSVLICGSLAFDTITNFPGRFAQQIMPDKVHMLNVSFLVPTMRREYGGCAGNIAYNLHLLGGQPLAALAGMLASDAYAARGSEAARASTDDDQSASDSGCLTAERWIRSSVTRWPCPSSVPRRRPPAESACRAEGTEGSNC